MTDGEGGILERLDSKIDRIDDKVDAALIEQQKLTDYQREANGSLKTMKAEIIDIKGWQYKHDLEQARLMGVAEGQKERVLSPGQWKTIVWVMGLVGTGAVAIVADVIHGIFFR